MHIIKAFAIFLMLALLQGCAIFDVFKPEEDRRVERIQALLRTACVSSVNSEISFKATGNGNYKIDVTSQSGNADLVIDASVIEKNTQGALSYADEELRSVQDENIRSCIKETLPTVLDELRTPRQKSAKCYREKTDEFVALRDFRTNEQSARASGPGPGGGRNTDDARLCYNGIAGYDKIDVNFRRTSCLGGRCRVGQIKTSMNQSTNTASACVEMRAWSESGPFGAGGRVAGYLYGTVSQTLSDGQKESIRRECDARYHVAPL